MVQILQHSYVSISQHLFIWIPCTSFSDAWSVAYLSQKSRFDLEKLLILREPASVKTFLRGRHRGIFTSGRDSTSSNTTVFQGIFYVMSRRMEFLPWNLVRFVSLRGKRYFKIADVTPHFIYYVVKSSVIFFGRLRCLRWHARPAEQMGHTSQHLSYVGVFKYGCFSRIISCFDVLNHLA